jgi:hypothetical protein
VISACSVAVDEAEVSVWLLDEGIADADSLAVGVAVAAALSDEVGEGEISELDVLNAPVHPAPK